MLIDKQKWDIIMDGLHLSDKEQIIAEAIKLLLNQAPDPTEIMKSVIVGSDEANVSIDMMELADMVNAALATLIFKLEDDEQALPENGDDADSRMREDISCLIEEIDENDGYDFVEELGTSLEEQINGSSFADFLIRVEYVVNL